MNPENKTIHTRICVPVTDLRREPVEAKIGYERDLLQESQLLYGEHIHIHEQHGDWLYIEALEQEKYSSARGWTGYFGWIKAEHTCAAKEETPNLVVTDNWLPLYEEPALGSRKLLSVSFGTLFQGRRLADEWYELLSIEGLRFYGHASGLTKCGSQTVANLLDIVRCRFLGTPYLWGGSSAYSSDMGTVNTGVDCSGLSRLLYRATGISIPRDARDQYLKLKETPRLPAKRGDLFFTSENENIHHVMIYAGDGLFLESTFKAGGVRMNREFLENNN